MPYLIMLWLYPEPPQSEPTPLIIFAYPWWVFAIAVFLFVGIWCFTLETYKLEVQAKNKPAVSFAADTSEPKKGGHINKRFLIEQKVKGRVAGMLDDINYSYLNLLLRKGTTWWAASARESNDFFL